MGRDPLDDDPVKPPIDRARQDPAFRRRVQAAYEGTYEVDDAFWWFDHPRDEAPSGHPSPDRQYDSLRLLAFQPQATADTRARLRAAEQELREEREWIRRAIEIAQADPRGCNVSDAEAFNKTSQSGLRGRLFIVGLVLVALATGAFLGSSMKGNIRVMAARSSVEPQPMASTLSPLEPAYPTLPAHPSTVFDRAQSSLDIPNGVVPQGYASLSFRRLTRPQSGFTIYAAKTSSENDVCLLVLSSEFTVAATCEAASSFPSQPLMVMLRLPARLAVQGGTVMPAVTATWSGDGLRTETTTGP